MKYVKIGGSGLKVSELCLGTMVFGSAADENESINIIDRAMDDGINFIDSANVYNDGEAERILGKAVRLHIYVVPGKTPFLCGVS